MRSRQGLRRWGRLTGSWLVTWKIDLDIYVSGWCTEGEDKSHGRIQYELWEIDSSSSPLLSFTFVAHWNTEGRPLTPSESYELFEISRARHNKQH